MPDARQGLLAVNPDSDLLPLELRWHTSNAVSYSLGDELWPFTPFPQSRTGDIANVPTPRSRISSQQFVLVIQETGIREPTCGEWVDLPSSHIVPRNRSEQNLCSPDALQDVSSFSEVPDLLDIASTPDQVLTDLKEHGVLLIDVLSLSLYLRRYPEVCDLLLPISGEIRRRLANPSQISIYVYEDPEFDDKYLTVRVRQEEYEPGIMDRIDEILEHFQADLVGMPGWLLVTTDFRRPQ